MYALKETRSPTIEGGICHDPRRVKAVFPSYQKVTTMALDRKAFFAAPGPLVRFGNPA
jgi:hypothetical protein